LKLNKNAPLRTQKSRSQCNLTEFTCWKKKFHFAKERWNIFLGTAVQYQWLWTEDTISN